MTDEADTRGVEVTSTPQGAPKATDAVWLRKQAEWHLAHDTGTCGDCNYPAEVIGLLDERDQIQGRAMWLARCSLGHVQMVFPEMDRYGGCSAPMWLGYRRAARSQQMLCGKPLVVEKGWTVSPPPAAAALDREGEG